MAAPTLTAVPSAVFAGDTVLFSEYFADYPASDGWAITFDFRAANGKAISFTSSQDSANSARHFVSLTPALTSTWIPADYSGVGRAIKSGQKITVWTGALTVNAELSSQTDNFDTRTHARKCLDAIESVLEGKATRDVLNTTIAGQSISRLTPDQLISFRAYYRAEVLAEETEDAIANGRAGGNQILVRFNQP
jgi:hypothetical protein